MGDTITFPILPQPDNLTCGPTCLHAVYRYYGLDLPLTKVIEEVATLDEGGTLAVMLASHALRQGFNATIYSYDLRMFDPTWFGLSRKDLKTKLLLQMEHKPSEKLTVATKAYLEFLDLGGRLRFDDLTPALIRNSVKRGKPLLTGLSATYLYQSPREFGPDSASDDVRGEPVGHFVVLHGYDRQDKQVVVADPLLENPYSDTHQYSVPVNRLLCAILLGVLTYDAKLLLVEPPRRRRKKCRP